MKDLYLFVQNLIFIKDEKGNEMQEIRNELKGFCLENFREKLGNEYQLTYEKIDRLNKFFGNESLFQEIGYVSFKRSYLSKPAPVWKDKKSKSQEVSVKLKDFGDGKQQHTIN